MPRSFKTLFWASLIGAFLATGCGAPPPPPPPVSTTPPAAASAERPLVAFKMVEQSFEPAHISLKANVTVTLSITNTTGVEHNLTVKDPEGHRVLDERLPAGATTTVPFAPTTQGTYIFYCKYALHRAFGEEGTLEVN